MKQSVVLLVTHATQYLNAVDKVLVMYEGALSFAGPYSELLAAVDLSAAERERVAGRRLTDDDAQTLRSTHAHAHTHGRTHRQTHPHAHTHAGPSWKG